MNASNGNPQPVTVNIVTGGQPSESSGLVNARVTAGTALEIGTIMEQAGVPDGAEWWMQKAIEAERSGGSVPMHIPGLPNNFGHIYDTSNALVKALTHNALSPQPTPHRFSEALHLLGAYTGIREPAEASSLTFAFLKAVARFPVIDAIIRTRQFQMTRFAKRPVHARDTGFEVRMKDRKAKVTRAAAKVIEELTSLIEHGGYYRNPDGSLRTNSKTGQPGVWDGNEMERAMAFRDFIAQGVRDSLSMDWFCYRMEPGNDQRKYPVVFFSPVASEMIRRTVWQKYMPRIDTSGRPIEFVELGLWMAGTVIREYTWDRMGVMIRSPRTDIFGRGYGLSECEIVLDIVAGMILGLRFSREYLDNNHVPPGIVTMSGTPISTNEQSIQALRQQIMHTTGGPNAFWKLLYLMFPAGQGDVKVTPLRAALGGTGEMQWAMQYWTALLNICCAVFTISAEEIGFRSFTLQRSTLSERSPEELLEHSEDKGFKPIAEALAATINENIIFRVNDEFEFGWVNLDARSVGTDLEEVQAQMSAGWTANEAYDEIDRPRKRHPVDPVLYEDISERFEETEFDTHEEWEMKVNEAYEAECKSRGYPIVWSQAWDVPAGNPSMMSVWNQEQGMLAKDAVQRQQQEAVGQLPGAEPEQGQLGTASEERNRSLPPSREELQPGEPVGKQQRVALNPAETGIVPTKKSIGRRVIDVVIRRQ